MIDPKNENAPRTWTDDGASRTQNNRRPQLIRRLFPADGITLGALAALLWRQARERFRQLGIPPDAFVHREARSIAGTLLNEREFTECELAVLQRDDGRTMSWLDAIDWFTTDRVEWAIQTIERFAYEFARFWLPAWLEWVARMMRTDGWTFRHAAHELDRMLSMARPCLLRDEQRGAP